jgi:hypothetical protein
MRALTRLGCNPMFGWRITSRTMSRCPDRLERRSASSGRVEFLDVGLDPRPVTAIERFKPGL